MSGSELRGLDEKERTTCPRTTHSTAPKMLPRGGSEENEENYTSRVRAQKTKEPSFGSDEEAVCKRASKKSKLRVGAGAGERRKVKCITKASKRGWHYIVFGKCDTSATED